ncbi:MAG: hypothetical protein MUO43_02730, partial [Desulfobacterales bacterium]|nr:hypothetical protein [Desulfobacterales bacterium]
MSTTWKTYEEVAKYLIDRFKSDFDLVAVEGKQELVGRSSGVVWNVDAKGIHEGGEDIVIIEARRYTTSRQNQEKLGALAYRIIDTGAKGGIIVSPLGLQKGAKKVAEANNIISVKLDKNSTPESFSIQFLKRLIIGA